MEVVKQNEKTFVRVSELKEWEKNPRYITEENFEKLKNDLKEDWEKGIKLFSPLKIDENGIVLGGNMRLRALKALEIEEPIWVEILKCKNESERMHIALRDNEAYGKIDQDKLEEFKMDFPEIDWNDYNVILSEGIPLERLMADDEEEEVDVPEEVERDQSTVKDKLEVYENNTIKQVVLHFQNDEFQDFLSRIKAVGEAESLENNTEIVLRLLEFYENNRG